MNANELTFGIEIETIAPDRAVRDDGLRIGGYRRGIQVPYLPAGWTAEADGSIDNGHGGHRCEIVSPVLRGAAGLAQAAEVLKTLEAKGHRVNASCGVHVHVGWRRDWPCEALARLVTIVAYVEKGLYAITGSKTPATIWQTAPVGAILKRAGAHLVYHSDTFLFYLYTFDQRLNDFALRPPIRLT